MDGCSGKLVHKAVKKGFHKTNRKKHLNVAMHLSIDGIRKKTNNQLEYCINMIVILFPKWVSHLVL